MAKRRKTQTVNKFGGTEKIADVKIARDPYEVSTVEAQSKTKLESDAGEGIAVVIREFEFGINPQVWREHPPTKQDLFNHHLKGVEIELWRDGLKPYTDVEPRLVVDADKMNYKLFIAAIPARGHLLTQTPRTLREIAMS